MKKKKFEYKIRNRNLLFTLCVKSKLEDLKGHKVEPVMSHKFVKFSVIVVDVSTMVSIKCSV